MWDFFKNTNYKKHKNRINSEVASQPFLTVDSQLFHWLDKFTSHRNFVTCDDIKLMDIWHSEDSWEGFMEILERNPTRVYTMRMQSINNKKQFIIFYKDAN